MTQRATEALAWLGLEVRLSWRSQVTLSCSSTAPGSCCSVAHCSGQFALEGGEGCWFGQVWAGTGRLSRELHESWGPVDVSSGWWLSRHVNLPVGWGS